MVQGSHDPRLSKKYKTQRLIVLARDGYECAYCGQDATTVDHIVSLKAGGDPIALDNMVACCKRCNSSKGSRSQGVFLASGFTPPVFSTYVSPMQSETMLDSPFKTRPNPDQ
jgi:5-methylcytosine-specific restriction endonuclease McrA